MKQAIATFGLLLAVAYLAFGQVGPSYFDWGDHYVRPSNPYVYAYMTITPDPVFWNTENYSFVVLRFAYDPTCIDIEIADRTGQWISINSLVAIHGRVSGSLLSSQYRVQLRADPSGFMGGYLLNVFPDSNGQNPGKYILEAGILEESSLLEGYFFGSIVGDEENGEFRPMRWRILNLSPGNTCCLVPARGYSGNNGQMYNGRRSPFADPPDGCFGTFTVLPLSNNTPPQQRSPGSIDRWRR